MPLHTKAYYFIRLNLIDPDNNANPYSTKDIPTDLLATKRNFSKANALLDDAITEYSADADKMYFHNYCKHWLETKKPSLEVGTYESYQYRMNNITSFFREKKILLAELKPEHINEFYNHLLTVEHGVGKRKAIGFRTGVLKILQCS